MAVTPDVIIDTRLSVTEVLDRLRASTTAELPLVALPLGQATRPLRGSVSGAQFAVKLRTRYRNAFALVLEGTVEPTPSGARLVGTFRPHAWALLGALLWLWGVLLLGYRALRLGHPDDAVFAAAMLLGGILIIGLGFSLARSTMRPLAAELRRLVDGGSPVAV
jgi:hypothetical protein